ncbi:proteasome complex subunit Rpn13 ubiquitin receptor-domain-containing protein [Schizophyllum amplum]|uniref:Proteasome complex subunit Rpn13 ubiquitin receptor-domain-containing protein n=1 Tax=Schizophyllum amplum TaxID=97359 RepID=A0A550CGN6_9AGAR|nr:proteasome complex subunit Rpn13 ubiquitin receptor-domain-containing protein [Auriculariopsis ampla]
MASEILLAFKAGRAVRRESSNFVDASATKGAVMLCKGEDELLHFMWKNRVTNDVEEDLILFPGDASFVKVSQTPGRVYVLKFSSSDQRHFFWMQDASPARDEEFVTNLNGLLEDPDFQPTWPEDAASTSTGPGTSNAPSASDFQATPEQLAQLQQILSRGGSGAAAEAASDVSLTDILTPANLNPLFTSHPELISTLFPHLPPDLPMPPSTQVLRQIINSPQFRSAVGNFDQALRTGLLGNLVRAFGLPEEAGTGIAPFLRAIQEQADRQGDAEDSMETD